MIRQLLRNPSGRRIYHFLLLLFSSVLVFAAILLPYYGSLRNTGLRVGDVAAQDLLAPESFSFKSEVLTKDEQQAAAEAVAPIYTPLDTSIARQQLDRLRAVLAFISSVRSDAYATLDQKKTDLAAMEDIHLSADTASKILSLSEARWQAVQQETIVVLEQVMRNAIRNDRLEEARRGVPALVSLSLPEDQAVIVAELTRAFVVPNSMYDSELTESVRQQARQSVQPVMYTFAAGETIVQRGQLITPFMLEALEQLGLVQPGRRWQDMVGAVLLTLLVVAYFIVYLFRSPRLLQDNRGPVIFAGLFLAFLLGARLAIPGHTIIPYLYPAMAFSLTVAALFNAELAFVSTVPLAVLIAHRLPNALELTLFYVVSSFFGILILGRGQRFLAFFRAGIAMSLSGMAMLVLFRLPDPSTDWIGVLTLAGAALVNGLASAGVSVLLQFFMAQALGMTTALQLVELTRPDNPLLQFILRNAPGTYQHSLQVANLAEQAAEHIGADPLLTRVGALYHDAGKALNPYFFIENQPAGNLDSHDDLDPMASAATIIHHVEDGLILARKYRLPRRIQDFIREHHGTLIAGYQYAKAIEAAGGDAAQVEIEKFRYPGPRPQSRETALLMLADGCEAKIRAEKPKNEAELHSLIQGLIEQRIKQGELYDTNLTLRALDLIVDSFSTTLRGVYHPRIEYPRLLAEGQALTGSLPSGSIEPREEQPSLPDEIH